MAIPLCNGSSSSFCRSGFYNNPRPFYGFEEQGYGMGAHDFGAGQCARPYVAPDEHFRGTSDRRAAPLSSPEYRRISEALLCGPREAAPDETNGNTPLVSAHEVAWYAWSVTKDPHIPELIAGGAVKNMADLCYQTLALAEIDPNLYRPLSRNNAGPILSCSGPNGQWSTAL